MCNQREQTRTASENKFEEGSDVRIKKLVGISSTPPHADAYFVYPGKILGVAGEFAVVGCDIGEPIAVRLSDLRQWNSIPLTNPMP